VISDSFYSSEPLIARVDIRWGDRGAETGSRDREQRQGAKTGSRDREQRQGAETGSRGRVQRQGAERLN
jgi:hypothetical protein